MTVNRFWAIGKTGEVLITPPGQGGKNGKGKGSDWTGRDGRGGIGGGKKKKGQSLIYPENSPAQMFSAYKNAAFTPNGATVTGWEGTAVNDGSAFNTTSGAWVATFTGPALFHWQGLSDTTVQGQLYLQENGVTIKEAKLSRAGSGLSADGSTEGWFMVNVVQGRSYTLYQGTTDHSWFHFTGFNVYSAVFWQMRRTAKFGTYGTNAAITGYDSVIENTDNFEGYADLATGIVTAPVAGPYFVWFSGHDGGMNWNTYNSHWLRLNGLSDEGTGFSYGCYGNRAIGREYETNHACAAVVWLEEGQQINLVKEVNTPGDIVFGGMLLHPNSMWLSAFSWGSPPISTLSGPNAYAGYEHIFGTDGMKAAFNNATGKLVLPGGTPSRRWVAAGAMMPTTNVAPAAYSRVYVGGVSAVNGVGSSSSSYPVRGHTSNAVGNIVGAGAELFNYRESAVDSDWGYFSAFTPWGSDL